MTKINANTPIDELTIGGNIYEAGMQKNLKQEIGVHQNLYINQRFANNVDFVLMYVLMTQYQLIKN